MITGLPSTFSTALELTSRKPIQLLHVITSEGIFYLSDKEVGTTEGLDYDYEPWIESWGAMSDQPNVNAAVRGGALEVKTVNIKFIKSPDSLDFINELFTIGIENIKIEFYQCFHITATTTTDAVLIDTFLCQDPISIKESNMTLTIDGVSPIMGNNPYLWFQDVSKDTYPIVIGKAVGLPLLDLNTSFYAEIASDISFTFIGTVTLARPQNFETYGGEEDYLFIGSEQVKYTGLGEDFLVITERGCNGSTARPHSSGASVTVPGYPYDYAVCAGPVTLMDNLKGDGIEYDNHFVTFPGKDPAIVRFISHPPWQKTEAVETDAIEHDAETAELFGSSTEYDYGGVNTPASAIPTNRAAINRSDSSATLRIQDFMYPADTFAEYWQELLAHYYRTDSDYGTLNSVYVEIKYSFKRTYQFKDVVSKAEVISRTTDAHADNSVIATITQDSEGETALINLSITSWSTLASTRVGVLHTITGPTGTIPSPFLIFYSKISVEWVKWHVNYTPPDTDSPDEVKVIYNEKNTIDVTSLLGEDPTPSEVIQDLLENHSDVGNSIDSTSFDAEHTAYNADYYYLNGTLSGDIRLHAALKKVLLEGMARLLFNEGEIKLITYNSEADTTADVIFALSDFVIKSRGIDNQPVDNILNDIRLRYHKNLAYDGRYDLETRYTDAESIDKYNVHDLREDYDLIHTSGVADKIASRRLQLNKNPVSIYTFECMLPTGYILEKGDRVTVPSFLDSTKVIAGNVLGITRNFGSGKNKKINTYTVRVIVSDFEEEPFVEYGDAWWYWGESGSLEEFTGEDGCSVEYVCPEFITYGYDNDNSADNVLFITISPYEGGAMRTMLEALVAGDKINHIAHDETTIESTMTVVDNFGYYSGGGSPHVRIQVDDASIDELGEYPGMPDNQDPGYKPYDFYDAQYFTFTSGGPEAIVGGGFGNSGFGELGFGV